MNTHDFFYELPPERIAQTPMEPRDHSRLMVLHRDSGELEHRHFYDLPEYLRPGDALVINDTRVLPARLNGFTENGAKMELLLLKRLDIHRWEALAGPAKKAKPGTRLSFGDGLLTAQVLETRDEGIRVVRFAWDGIFEDVLNRVGAMPLPPYIHASLEDKERYQTVYSREVGSAAAPTAGLHFTPCLLEKIRAMGVAIVPVLLHVGLGTFRPVKADKVEEHVMHSEYYEVSPQAAEILNQRRAAGGRIVVVGTTSARTLETVTDENGIVHPGSGNTQIFIYPGYKFKAVDAMITNFHLPESTLVMMIAALVGRERILSAYKTAVDMEYRFFSFGDAMFIL